MEHLFNLNSNKNNEDIAAKYEKIILEPYHHVNENKGKGFRTLLIEVYNHWLKIDKIDIELVTKLIQNLHTGSLLLDDIQDSSELRRGNPAAHIIYGMGRTITATDLSLDLSIFLQRNIEASPKISSFQDKAILNLLKGQIMEIYWRDNYICPSEEEYFDMVNKKTGQMLFLVSGYMELCSKSRIDLKNLTILLGIYFQLTDDYNGLKSKLYYTAKGFCDDIREGKFIFPIIHAINSRPNDNRILEILKMRTDDMNLKMECLALLEEFGSMEYTKSKIIYYKTLIVKEVEKFELNDNFMKLFEFQHFAE